MRPMKRIKSEDIKNTPIEREKLYFYITIVNKGQADAVINLMEYVGSSVSFVQTGEGSAPTKLKSILSLEDDKKEIIISFIKEILLEDAEKELNAFFEANKKNRGVAFAIPLNSIVGERVYKFLTKTI